MFSSRQEQFETLVRFFIVVDSIGVSIWQMVATPYNRDDRKEDSEFLENADAKNRISGSGSDDDEKTGSESEDDDEVELREEPVTDDISVAIACDDGCVRIYTISDSDELVYHRSLPRVSGRVLSVTWSPDGNKIYSGSSDRCWDAKTSHEIYRITVGLGGLGSGPELCIWSLPSLRCGSLVSADSSGSVQFWDIQFGTFLQAHSRHKGDVNVLAAAPSHNRVFFAGSDGQVMMRLFNPRKTTMMFVIRDKTRVLWSVIRNGVWKTIQQKMLKN